MLFQDFQQIGADLFLRGMVSSHGGNLSIRLGDKIIITRRSAQLAHLTEQDLIETALIRNDRSSPTASSELRVHRTLYQETGAQAIVHAHPVHAVALSFQNDSILPLEAEAYRNLGTVPVAGDVPTHDARRVIEELTQLFQEHKIVIVRGHGTFAVGQLLEEAYRWTSLLEEGCRLILTARLMASLPDLSPEQVGILLPAAATMGRP